MIKNTNKHINFLNIRVGDYILLLLFNLLFFQISLAQVVPAFNYLDEFSALAIFLIAIVNCAKSKANVNLPRAYIYFSICIFLGILGSLLNDYQPVLLACVIDIITCTKFFIALGGAYLIFRNRDNECLLKLLIVEARILTVLLFVLVIVNLFFDSFMRASGRLPIPAFQAFWPHPTYVVLAAVILTCLLSCEVGSNGIFIALSLVVIASTLRAKGLAFIVIFLYLCFVRRKGEFRFSLLHLAPLSLLLIFATYEALEVYFLDASMESPRKLLNVCAIEIANTHFPLGVGFASYGSNASAFYYSNLYYELGFYNVWGMQPGAYFFISDSFWPTVLAQFGWLGFLAFLFSLYHLFVWLRRSSYSSNAKLALLSCFFYLLVSSTSESAFFNTFSPLVAVTMAFLVSVRASHQSEGSLN